jgi:hypothetical protein
MTNITVRLPDELARQAQSAGVLRGEAIAAPLREAMQYPPRSLPPRERRISLRNSHALSSLLTDCRRGVRLSTAPLLESGGRRCQPLKEPPMNAQADQLIEKLKALPPERRAEVEDFVDFLEKRDAQARSEAAQRLGEAFKRLDALDEPPMSAEEIQAEIDAVRAERRARADRR